MTEAWERIDAMRRVMQTHICSKMTSEDEKDRLREMLSEIYDMKPGGTWPVLTVELASLMLSDFYEVMEGAHDGCAKLPSGWTKEQAAQVLCWWPRWDDGSPCMFGDEFSCYPKYDMDPRKVEVLDKLTVFGPNHVWNRGRDDEKPHDGGYYEWNYMRPGGEDCEEYRPHKVAHDPLDPLIDAVLDIEESMNNWVDRYDPDERRKAKERAEHLMEIVESLKGEKDEG